MHKTKYIIGDLLYDTTWNCYMLIIGANTGGPTFPTYYHYISTYENSVRIYACGNDSLDSECDDIEFITDVYEK